MKYALIENSTIINIIEINPRNITDFPTAVSVEDYPVCIGDTYENNTFYRGGEEVLSYERLSEIEDVSRDTDAEVVPDPLDGGYQAEIETYKAALNTLGVETEEVTNDAE